MGAIKAFLCRHLCPKRTSKTELEQRAALPKELREASHEVSNAAQSIKGSVPRVRHQANIFRDLAQSLRNESEAQ